ncbi:transcriptional regulator [Klebsiella variicola]|uniref:FadR/GntR family transcriptional regulator n=1 Tax=Klebsiella variicola TaxID=244366 RepID=UPI0009BC40A6|nr:FadR/GntR family transcriptional regulator [Klebsiella variicola]HBZ7669795.1 FadR family transcriptional regulator [Klebsiella variicola subsp. variicola]ELC9130240.1 FadR family transcriptional regulator [Klebsiella variicola]MBG2046358.1 FadR family transcriptional regulator [Klebsiella variicola]MBZ6720440.1 FadR family transcriptional regulator [Klebsiella variicola]MDU5049440.1 FadR/GntR family transcriptional regulator [Klebsiella variicola]
MSIKSIQKQNVVNEIYDQISCKLLDGSWAPGSRLPSEAELTTSLNVSRVSVRSAVQRLRDLGIVVTRQGSGSYVSENFTPQMLSNDPRPIMHLSREEFHDMMIFRQTVEFKCVELAVTHATDDDIRQLEEALNNMLIHKGDYKKYSEADYEFHLAIVRASHNSVFYNVMSSIKDIYYYYLEELNRALGITLESVEAHIKVYMSIKNRDASTAVEVLNEAMSGNIIAIEKIKSTETSGTK